MLQKVAHFVMKCIPLSARLWYNIPIDEAAKLLRIAEANVTAPTAEVNPFGYLKKMCPEFTKAM